MGINGMSSTKLYSSYWSTRSSRWKGHFGSREDKTPRVVVYAHVHLLFLKSISWQQLLSSWSNSRSNTWPNKLLQTKKPILIIIDYIKHFVELKHISYCDHTVNWFNLQRGTLLVSSNLSRHYDLLPIAFFDFTVPDISLNKFIQHVQQGKDLNRWEESV